jgi:hypothetical protein
MGVDQVSEHDHSTDTDGGDEINPSVVDTETLSNGKYASAYSGTDGGAQIQNAVDDAASDPGPNVVIVDGAGPDDVSASTGSIDDPALSENAWELSSAVTLPDNTDLVVAGAYLFLSDGADDNIARNDDLSAGNVRLAVVGGGNAILDGNASNQTTLSSDRRRNQGLRFHNVTGLQLTNVTIRNTASWGIKVENYDGLNTEGLHFEQDGSKPNQDGLHLVGPSAGETTIGTVSGGAKDDLVAVCGYDDADTSQTDGSGGDIEHVSVEGVLSKGNTTGGGVRVYTAGGSKVSHITVGEVVGTSPSNQPLVRVGSTTMGAQPSPSDLRNITFESVTAEGVGDEGSVATLESPCEAVRYGEVNCRDGFKQVFLSKDAYTYNDIVLGGGVAKLGSGKRVLDFRGTFDGLTVEGWVFSGGADRNIYQDSNSSISDLTIRDCEMDPAGVAGEFAVLQGQVNEIAVSDIHITDCYNVFDFSDASGVIRDVELPNGAGNAVYKNIPSGIRFGGNVPPTDVRAFGNVQASRAYHDGSGSNTAGPAFNDGSGWVSTVDGSTIS